MPDELARLREGDWSQAASHIQRLARSVNPPVPQARVYNSSNIQLTTAAEATLTFDTERYDSGDLHSTSSNTGRLTAPITGLYSVGANVRFASNATGQRQVALRINGTTFIAYVLVQAANGDATFLNVSTDYQLTAGDYVEVRAYQNSGGNLNVTASANYSPEFWMHRAGGFVNQGV